MTELTDEERAVRDGAHGPAAAMAMRLVAGLARVVGARRLLPVASAHVDGCLYHGRAGLDFAERLAEHGGRVTVPTTLNVGSLDLLHPGLVRADQRLAAGARRLMDAYTTLGCSPTWTCAPYQLAGRPAFGTHVAWAESNAIAFGNSVLGARTDRYGDFLDISAAITGRVPEAGLHLDANRRARLVLDGSALPRAPLAHTAAWGALGQLTGRIAGTRVPVWTGLPGDVDEDRLKAFGAAAASAGGVALFHIVGVTPEAPDLGAVLAPGGAEQTVTVDAARLRAARDELTTAAGDGIDAVSLGTPHFSLAEFAHLAGLLADGAPFHPDVTVYVSTGRAVAAEAERLGHLDVCRRAGARILTDTCTYVTPVLAGDTRTVMTDSGKWAWYAPGNIGVDVVFGTLAECVASARAGRVRRDDRLWA